MIGLFTVETDLKVEIIACERCDLCAVQRQDMIYDGIDSFLSKIDIVNAKIVIKPSSLR